MLTEKRVRLCFSYEIIGQFSEDRCVITSMTVRCRHLLL